MSSTAVYGVSVDSRARRPGDPDNSYTVSLGRTLDRVKSIQLASFQFQDCRPAYGPTATLGLSEPVVIPADTALTLVETTTTVDTTTGATSSTSRTLNMAVPPTLNAITAYTGATDTVTTTSPTGLYFGVNFYPLVGLNMNVVGAHFPIALTAQNAAGLTTGGFPTTVGPLLTTATTVAPYTTTGLANSFTYTAGYIDALANGSTAAERADRHIGTNSAGTSYTSYVHAPRPTVVELLTMLNAAVDDMIGRTDLTGTVVGATNAIPIVVTSGAAHGLATGDQVVVSGVGGNLAANGTFIVTVTSLTTFELDGSTGSGGYTAGGTWTSPQQLRTLVQFGFDATGQVVARAPRRVTTSPTSTVTTEVAWTGSLATLLGFNASNRLDPPAAATLPSSILRTFALPRGTFTADEVVTNVTNRLNPLVFKSDIITTEAANRTLYFTRPDQSDGTVTWFTGRYTPTQWASHVTDLFATAAANLDVTVTYSDVTGRFTFTHNLGLPFGLNFEVADTLVTTLLGFEPIIYSNSSSYTSPNRAVFGTDPGVPTLRNVYGMVQDATDLHYTFFTINPEPIIVYGGQTGAALTRWQLKYRDTTSIARDYASNLQPGDILYATRPVATNANPNTGLASLITGMAASGSLIEVTVSAAHGLTTGDNVTINDVAGTTEANGTWGVTVTAATTFTLDGSTFENAYTSGGQWWINSWDDGVVAGNPAATYTVVVAADWDGNINNGRLTFEHTASIFSDVDAGSARPYEWSLSNVGGVADVDPSLTNNAHLLQDARRNVFQLHFKPPEGDADNFGFPAIVWPPSEAALQTNISGLSAYNTTSRSVPVSSSYTSEYCYTLIAPDYLLVVLRVPCASQDIHTHNYPLDNSRSILAKMLINFPFINITEEMTFNTFAAHARFNEIAVEFQNADGSLVDFNGRPHTYTLLFTVHQDNSTLPCY